MCSAGCEDERDIFKTSSGCRENETFLVERQNTMKPWDFPHFKGGGTSGINGYSEKVVLDVLNSRNVSYTDVKTSHDMKLLRLSWIFDINFKYTLLQIKERGFIEKIIKALPSNEEILKVSKYIEEYIIGRL
jgi:hypothetical protein